MLQVKQQGSVNVPVVPPPLAVAAVVAPPLPVIVKKPLPLVLKSHPYKLRSHSLPAWIVVRRLLRLLQQLMVLLPLSLPMEVRYSVYFITISI